MKKSFLHRLKLGYSLYNFFNKKELYHNEVIYKQLGLKKKYYSSVSNTSFTNVRRPIVANAGINKAELASCQLYKQLSQENKESLLAYDQNGFSIIRSYLSEKKVDEINTEIERLLEQKKVKFTYGNKIRFAVHVSPLLLNIGTHLKLKELLCVLLGGNPMLFQSTNFLTGSQQASHSDSIHFTTYPLGGMIAVWIALEDIAEDNGPLHYYPGSHTLPYYLNANYGNEGNRFLIGNKSSEDYEAMIRRKIEELGMKQVKFTAKKGDLLLWHANMVHGGDIHINKSKTRKSVVFHYFKENSVCYHEITQRPALIKKKYS